MAVICGSYVAVLKMSPDSSMLKSVFHNPDKRHLGLASLLYCLGEDLYRWRFLG